MSKNVLFKCHILTTFLLLQLLQIKSMHVKLTANHSAITPPRTDHVTKCDIDEIAPGRSLYNPLYPNPNPNANLITSLGLGLTLTLS